MSMFTLGLLTGLCAGGLGLGVCLLVAFGAVAARRSRDDSRRIASLTRRCSALARRAGVADALAGQERERADQAAAGMFELLSGLVAAEEATRGQLSAELHDTVAQSLLLARSTLNDPEAPPARASDLVDEAEQQLRAVMARTRPPALRDGDLATGVADLRADLAHRYGLDVEVSWPQISYPLPMVVAVTVYRFFQEALINVVKHSDVDRAQLALAVENGRMVARISDSGPGFDPASVRPSPEGRQVGLGLLRERVRLAGGTLEIDSRRGGPTCLTLRLPLSAPLPERAAATTAG